MSPNAIGQVVGSARTPATAPCAQALSLPGCQAVFAVPLTAVYLAATGAGTPGNVLCHPGWCS